MYRNLDALALGITGRQSELIELALTHGFEGLDLDMAPLVRRATSSDIDTACRFVSSAGIRIGEFEVPITLNASEMDFQAALKNLELVAQLAAALNAGCGRITIAPVSLGMTYQENFELHRTRITVIADLFGSHNIRIGLALAATPALREEAEQSFIHTSEDLVTLVRTIGHPHVGIALDTWEWFVGGGSLESLLTVPTASIVALRCADISPDADLATISEQQRVLPNSAGLVDSRAVVQHLVQHDFDGPLTLAPCSSSYAGQARELIVKQARAALDDLLSATPPVYDAGDDTNGDSSSEALATEAVTE